MPPLSSTSLADRALPSLLPYRLPVLAKRGLDLMVSCLMVVAFAPLLIAIWAAVRLTSPGAALFVQERVGRNGVVFPALKFRTMAVDAEERLAAYLAADPVARAEYKTFRKLRHDPRITPIGTFLRRYSLDELPQLFNVLRGEMSLVGPRCYMPCELEDMAGKQPIILSVLPGITGLWQVSGRNSTTFAQRLDFDVRYVREHSLALDLAILMRTIWVVLAARNAY